MAIVLLGRRCGVILLQGFLVLDLDVLRLGGVVLPSLFVPQQIVLDRRNRGVGDRQDSTNQGPTGYFWG